MCVNSLPKTASRLDLNPGPSAPESSTHNHSAAEPPLRCNAGRIGQTSKSKIKLCLRWNIVQFSICSFVRSVLRSSPATVLTVQKFNQSPRLVTLGHKWRHCASCSSRVSGELLGVAVTCLKSICRLFRQRQRPLYPIFDTTAFLVLERISRRSEANTLTVGLRRFVIIWALNVHCSNSSAAPKNESPIKLFNLSSEFYKQIHRIRYCLQIIASKEHILKIL